MGFLDEAVEKHDVLAIESDCGIEEADGGEKGLAFRKLRGTISATLRMFRSVHISVSCI